MTDTPEADRLLETSGEIALMAKTLIIAEAKGKIQDGNDMMEAAMIYNTVVANMMATTLMALRDTLNKTKREDNPNHRRWVALSMMTLEMLSTFVDEPRAEVAKHVKGAGQ